MRWLLSLLHYSNDSNINLKAKSKILNFIDFIYIRWFLPTLFVSFDYDSIANCIIARSSTTHAFIILLPNICGYCLSTITIFRPINLLTLCAYLAVIYEHVHFIYLISYTASIISKQLFISNNLKMRSRTLMQLSIKWKAMIYPLIDALRLHCVYQEYLNGWQSQNKLSSCEHKIESWRQLYWTIYFANENWNKLYSRA